MKIKYIPLALILLVLISQNSKAQETTETVQASLQKKEVHQSTFKNKKFSALGKWRGVFKIKPGLEIPFNFDVVTKQDKEHLLFLNADERFEGGIIEQTDDSLFVKLNQFDNELAFKIEGDSLVGILRKQDKTGRPTAISAERGKAYRFAPTGVAPVANFSGTYDVVFKSPNGNEEKAVGLFKQDGNKLSGTFLRITGDSRYLEGTVEGNEFQLSGFIGSGPSYYKGTFSKDGTLSGAIVGARGSQPFAGVKNNNAALADPYKLTFLKEGYKTLDFSFPDVNGTKISLKDDKFKNKVVILTITGTWCPNCADEAAFIAPWYKENKKRGVEVVGIHYERQTDAPYVQKVLSRFREKYDIQYDQVIAGTADKQIVANSLPALNTFLSFPTTIIIDKKGNVAQIHTGYSGPATGKYYDEFIKEFNQEIDKLLKD